MQERSLMARQNKHTTALRPLVGMAYAAPVVPVVLLLTSTNVLSGIYAQYYGLPLASVAAVMLVAGLFDAFTDPSIGYLSDRYHARTGSRRPFVVGGALLFIPSAWFLLNPGGETSVIYFLFWYLAFYLSYTLFNIPHLTSAGEICPHSTDRNKIFGYRSFAGFIAFAIFMAIPMTPLTEGSEVTPQMMRYLVIAAGLLLLPSLLFYMRNLSEGEHRYNLSEQPESPVRAIKELAHNKPLMLYIAGLSFYFVAIASDASLKFMVMSSYLDIGEYYVYLYLLTVITSILTIKMSLKLIDHIGKKKSCIIAFVLNIVAFSLLPIILLRGDYYFHLYVLYSVLFGISGALGNVTIFSMLSDIADYGTLKTGIDRSATCFSLHSLASKTFLTIGIAFFIAFASWFGFDPAAPSQGGVVYWGLAISMGMLPMACVTIATFFIWRIPVDERHHDIIRRRLDSREARPLWVSRLENESYNKRLMKAKPAGLG